MITRERRWPRRIDLYYEAADGISQIPCTLTQAQIWLLEGYLESTTKFKLKRENGTMGEWKTLGELISRNGRAMPFIEDESTEEEAKEIQDELQRLQEEMKELNNRKDIVERAFGQAMLRHNHNVKELNRLAKLAPIMSTRSLQTHVTLSGVVNGEPTVPQVPREYQGMKISVPPGVNPFALLDSCDSAKYKMPRNLFKTFKELRALFDQCDKKLLVFQTRDLFLSKKKCGFCQLIITSASTFMEHITSARHIEAMQGTACAEAYDFWYNSVQNDPRLLVSNRKLTVEVKGPGYSREISLEVKPGPSSVIQPPKRSVPGAAPVEPPNLPVFSILRKEKKVDKICPNPKDELAQIKKMLTSCDKKKLDNDKNTMGWFEEPMICLICDRCAIDKVSNLIAHITGTGHVEMIVTENFPVSQNALDFWTNVIKRASKNTSSNEWKEQSSVVKITNDTVNYVRPIEHVREREEKNDVQTPVSEGNVNQDAKDAVKPTVSKEIWRVGDRCVWKGEEATVRWLGILEGHADMCAGIEFDKPVGQGTGTYRGKDLFCTPSNHAGFVKLSEMRKIDIETVSLAEYNGWKIGRRCVWKGEDATVRWIGTLKGFESVYAGLAFDDPVGEGSGTYQGVELFKATENHAGIVMLSTISPLQEKK